MKMNTLRTLLLLLALGGWSSSLYAQDDDFDMSDFEISSDAKTYCDNKVIGISPTKLLSLSFDYAGPNTWTSTAGDAFEGTYPETDQNFSRNFGMRLETNYLIISTNRLIVNAYLNYWESRYDSDQVQGEVGRFLSSTNLRTTALGASIFKPLNERNFLLFQVEGSLNGNYGFGDNFPEFSKMKFSAAALYGWKTNDNTNVAVGVTRTYRGGRLLHIPVLLWNKTFNDRWGVEMLLPARAAVRRRFSSRSIFMLGYELEGQSYHMRNTDGSTPSSRFASTSTANDWELRKSEIRARLSWDKSLSNFVWFNVQAGAVVTYRMDIDQDASDDDAWITNEAQVPFYFRVGIQLVSP